MVLVVVVVVVVGLLLIISGDDGRELASIRTREKGTESVPGQPTRSTSYRWMFYEDIVSDAQAGSGVM